MTPAEETKYDYGYDCGSTDARYGRFPSPLVPGESPYFRQGYDDGFTAEMRSQCAREKRR